MGAIGFTLLCVCIDRIIFDEPKYFPMLQEDKWKWGLTIIASLVLMVASVAKAIWEFMP